MSVIKNKRWRGEPLKAVIKIDDNNEYIVYTDIRYGNTRDSYIKSVSFRGREGNSNVNPLGISVSSSVSLRIYDASDSLSPCNKQSKYYGKLVNGIEINLFISYDGVNFSNYGVYYVTSWSGGYSNGGYDLVNITAEDKLNTIGNYDLPELPAYSNVEAGDLIANVMQGLNISTEEYTIDSAINKNLMFGLVQGTKVRDFFNNICQLLFARVIIDRNNVIRFVPALSIYNNANELTIGSEDVGTIINKNSNNINYNKVKIKYLEGGDISRELLFSDNSRVLNDGNNLITDITFKHRALSIENVNILYKKTDKDAIIKSLNYRGYQNGIQLNINVENGPINECSITGKGLIVSTTEKYVEAEVKNASVIGGTTFVFDTKQMMSDSEADSLAKELSNYLETMSKIITFSGTVLSPELDKGDKVIIKDTNTIYDGEYKIIESNIDFSDNYNYTFNAIMIS